MAICERAIATSGARTPSTNERVLKIDRRFSNYQSETDRIDSHHGPDRPAWVEPLKSTIWNLFDIVHSADERDFKKFSSS